MKSFVKPSLSNLTCDITSLFVKTGFSIVIPGFSVKPGFAIVIPGFSLLYPATQKVAGYYVMDLG